MSELTNAPGASASGGRLDGVVSEAGGRLLASNTETESVNRRLAVREDHWCFGCGRQNPIGLKLTFYEDGEQVWAPWTPRHEHQGYEGIVHGGLITTVLDEVMGWAIYVRRLWAASKPADTAAITAKTTI